MSKFIRNDSDIKENKEKIPLASIFFSVFFGIIVLRLMQLQLVRGKEFRQFSENNRITVEKVYALRGELLDRKGRLMAGNRPSFDLLLTRGYFGKQKDAVYDFLRNDLGFDEARMNALAKKFSITPVNDAVVVLEDIDWDIIAKTRAKNYMLPGVEIVYRPMRLYPHDALGCHLLGYLREVDKPRLAEFQAAGDERTTLGDYIGVWGIEKVMDSDLRGVNGARPIVEDAFGRELGEATTDLLPNMQKRKAVAGKNLVLTVDLDVQQAAEESFGTRSGAAVAIDPKSGDILAMVSKPCFDLRKFSRNIPGDYWQELRANPAKPLYDRATMGIYPPGSTFKVVMGAAGLRSEQVDPGLVHMNQYRPCDGNLRIGRETKRCWKDYPGHNHLDLPGAIQQSCDVFFYQLGLELGIDRIAEEAKRFGMGRVSGLGINQEQRGIVPTAKWKQQYHKTPWMDGETASVAIGQGYLAATPMQMARVTGAIANFGKLVKPRLVIRAEDPTTGIVSPMPVEQDGDVGVDAEHMKQIVDGMDKVVNTTSGTAYWGGRSTKVRIAGKTGTAQVMRQRRGQKMAEGFEDHAWFIAFAPVEDPQIAVAVLVENGGHGGSAAAPIARKIIETYLVPPEPPKL